MILANSWWTGAATATLIAAAIAAVVALIGVWLNGVRAERDRRRQLYAGALAATMDYREFAYAVRRRQASDPASERIRISEALRLVQKDIDHHLAMLEVERSQKVATNYRNLVGKTREIAGGYIKDSWTNGAGINTDTEMNVDGIDFQELKAYEKYYLEAVDEDLAWWRDLAFWRI